MNTDVLPFDPRHLHGTDSNSLLRMYDLAHDIAAKSRFQQQRVRADKAIQRIAKELRKRNVPYLKQSEPGPSPAVALERNP
jgi:hypothetical protein